MSLVVSGVIGALCALTLVLIVGTIALFWRRRRYQRVCRDIERSSSSSYYSSSGHTIPSFAGIGSFLTVRGSMSSNISPPSPALWSQTSIKLERSTDVRNKDVSVSSPRQSGESTVLLPDNLQTELQSTKVLVARSEFLCAEKPIYDPGWLPTRIAAFVVGKPLWWALEQMGVVGEEGFLSGGMTSRSPKDTAWWGEYVFVPLVEKAADAVLERQAAKMGGMGNQLYSMDMFRHEFGSVLGVDVLSDVDVMVLLKFLERDRSALVFDKEVRVFQMFCCLIVKFIQVVKFLSDNVSNHREINAVDRGILELRKFVQNLHAQVDGLQCKMDECTKKATAAVEQKQRIVALSHLRLKKELEDLLSKRLGSLDNLESTLLRVEAAAGDIEILKTYESSTATLRAILAHPSLQRDSIDFTIEALAEANVDAKEVDDAVRKGADNAFGVDGIDNGELEEELKALVLESEREKEQEQEGLDNVKELSERLRVLPNAPSDVSLPTEATRSKIAQT
ncbi:hypothetical protein C0993_011467 [Termitomyces sp. T159_Od127]|nr:hypothetical protein C0993_011467 [Termitomyces sp. T159_Od127]